MPQQERTAEGEQRWNEVTERARVRAKKHFDRIQEFVQRTGTLVLDEGELIKLLTGFALDERKREEHKKFEAATAGQPEVHPEDQHFAELASAEMARVPRELQTNDLWLRFVTKGIARARKHWEENLKNRPDVVAQEFKAQEAHPPGGCPQCSPGPETKPEAKPAGCYEKGRATGEPMFTLLARDVTAPWVVFEWVRRNWHHCRPEKLGDALRIAQEMERWPNKKAAD